jgi:uncharacterized protein
MTQSIDWDRVREFVKSTGPRTKIYLGVDSRRRIIDQRWWADYSLAVVVHVDSCHGCKVFGEIQTEPDWDQRPNRPSTRLLNEAIKVSELYHKLIQTVGPRPVEIHLDINADHRHASSSVLQSAVGYVRGTCQQDPVVKPHSFAASYCADRLRYIVMINL